MSDIETSQEIVKIIGALIQAEKEFPTFAKTEKSYTGKYTKLESIQDEIIPILLKYDMIVIQLPGELSSSILIENEINDKGQVLKKQSVQYSINITTRLQHVSGEYVQGTTGMPLPSGKSVNITQEAGMAITYAKRYALSSMLDLIIHGEDFDGNNHNRGYQEPTNPKGNRLPRLSVEEAKKEILEMIEKDSKSFNILDKDQSEKIISAIQNDKPFKGGWLALHEKLKQKLDEETPVF